MQNITVGHTMTLALVELDQNGNPEQTTIAPDSPPTWTNLNAAAETLVAAADGMTCVATAVAAGTDTITVSATFSGKVLTGTLSVGVQAAPQVLTSVAIQVESVS